MRSLIDEPVCLAREQHFFLHYSGHMARARVGHQIGVGCPVYEDFLALWKDADPDVPILKKTEPSMRDCSNPA